MTTTARYAFDADTASTRLGEHQYGLELSQRWRALGGHVNGGYLIAACLQALHQEIPHPDLLAASAHYLRPAMPGPARIHTDIARIGRRTATGQARLTRDDREILRVLATFTDLATADGPTVLRDDPPVLPPPERCFDPMAVLRPPEASIADQVEFRMPQIPGFWHGTPTGASFDEFWMRFTDGRPADPIALALLVDAAAPVVLDLGVVPASATVELTVHIRNRPAPGWLACRVATRFLIDGFHEEDFEIWDSMGTLVAQSRQLSVIP
ncbi:thioesterase family protein [Nocardia sp. NPDC052566]|uniref:thioesterase family protein n=1 Tax=Nocardia sp. NPDC052566 TaxID=3364330 RepID=UPI0037C78F7F